MNYIEKYYNKFNEDKRLATRHGIVEFEISIENIKQHLKAGNKIIDIGAGTGRYSIELANLGFDVTAVELVKKNLSIIKQKSNLVKAFQGNAVCLKKFKDNSFDVCILFGPMYHLFSHEEKVKALLEAKRITKIGGYIFVAYLLTDYALIRHGFMDHNIIDSIKNNKVDSEFNINSSEEDLYSYVRLDEIEQINSDCNIKREYIFSPDGATDYIRSKINTMSEEEFKVFIRYQKAVCKRMELLGASSHVVDVLINN